MVCLALIYYFICILYEVQVDRDRSVGIATGLWAGRCGDRIPPIPVAERSKARVCGRSLAGIAGSSTTGSTDVCVVEEYVMTGYKSTQWIARTETKKESTKKKSSLAQDFHTLSDRPWDPPNLCIFPG